MNPVVRDGLTSAVVELPPLDNLAHPERPLPRLPKSKRRRARQSHRTFRHSQGAHRACIQDLRREITHLRPPLRRRGPRTRREEPPREAHRYGAEENREDDSGGEESAGDYTVGARAQRRQDTWGWA